MQSVIPYPQLSTVSRYNRKYGRYDFDRFDHLVSQYASLGAASVGKIHVDCRFLFKKSKWGTLEAQHPAGVIYLDLTFNQPSDCRLKNATVQVTLDDEDESLVRQFSNSTKTKMPVQIVKYGPRQMTGEPRYEQITTHNTFIPSIEAGPFGGAGGIGRESEKMVMRECRWTFESHLMTDSRKKKKGHNWAYKVLQWHLTENELETQSIHNNLVHTAFSFVHSGQPFFMRVEVSGRLESVRSDLSQQLKHKIRKLKFPANPQNARYATTLINFDGRDRFKNRLDGLVQGLELAMEHENMSPPVEVQKSQPATYQEATTEATGTSVTVPGYATGLLSPQIKPLVEDGPISEEQEDPTAPTIQNLQSLSARWLMSPPVSMNITSESLKSKERVNTSPDPANTVRDRSEIYDEPIISSNGDTKGQKTPTANGAAHQHDEPRETAPLIRTNEVQQKLSNGQVEFETVALIMRIWVLQAIMNVLSSLGVSKKKSTFSE
ncbi:hypothetical protein F4779DRAFT_604025 [Xylariaceae sp. FL0662B]|nr:hypothetical protein F4779DRAFT_604025 [Xylariaceae sp. FL0662B]